MIPPQRPLLVAAWIWCVGHTLLSVGETLRDVETVHRRLAPVDMTCTNRVDAVVQRDASPSSADLGATAKADLPEDRGLT